MNRIITIILIALLCNDADAQQKFSIIVGLKTNFLKSLPDPTKNQLFNNYLLPGPVYGRFEPKIGYEIGIAILHNYKRYQIESQFKYSMNRESLIKKNYATLIEYEPLLLENHNLDISCVLREDILQNLYISLGGTFQAKIKSTTDKIQNKVQPDYIFAFGVKGGIGIKIKNKFDIQINEQFSNNIFTTGNTIKNGHTVSLNLLYWVNLSKSNDR